MFRLLLWIYSRSESAILSTMNNDERMQHATRVQPDRDHQEAPS
jgi:hypothetical protein